ncbi:MAG TPA: SRPBCC family protein [Anaerolineae bacterium]|nr:SRPBCC family protein [Anaerolineae bacterium]
MAKLETSITINRPIEEVFAFAADIANYAEWETGVIAAEVTSPGPVGVGTQYKIDAEFMGRKLETTGELTAYDPPRITAWKATSGPFAMSGSTTFESVAGGTRVVSAIEAEPGGFFKLAEPLLVRQMRGQMEKDVKKLKELLEAR